MHNVRASIRTRYHGPTNTTGARISVTDGGNPFGNPRKIYVAWDSFNGDQYHSWEFVSN